MKIKEFIIMPQSIKPLGLIHKPGVGPNNRFDFKNKGNNKANEIEKEEAARKQSDTERSELILPDPNKMPRVPEPLGTPKSLGGLAGRAGVDLENDSAEENLPTENNNLDALRERTEEWSEDIAEANIVQKVINEERIGEELDEVESSEVDVE